MSDRSRWQIGSTQQGADEGATGTTRTRAQIEKYHRRSEKPKHKKSIRIKKLQHGGRTSLKHGGSARAAKRGHGAEIK